MYVLPKDTNPGVDKIVLDDKTALRIDASYPLGERWVIEAGRQMIQLDPDVKILIQRPA